MKVSSSTLTQCVTAYPTANRLPTSAQQQEIEPGMGHGFRVLGPGRAEREEPSRGFQKIHDSGADAAEGNSVSGWTTLL